MLNTLVELLDQLHNDFGILRDVFSRCVLSDVHVESCKNILYQQNAFKVNIVFNFSKFS